MSSIQEVSLILPDPSTVVENDLDAWWDYLLLDDAVEHNSVVVDMWDLQEKAIHVFITERTHATAADFLQLWVEVSPLGADRSVTWVTGTPGRPGPNGEGDVDGDGVVTSADVILVERQVLALDPPTFRGDVNGDGAWNALDITACERLVAGIYAGSANWAATTEINHWTRIGNVQIINSQGTEQWGTQQSLILPFTTNMRYARLCAQVNSVVADAYWLVKAYIRGKA